MIYIATTTINKTTETLKRFDNSKNCKVIIALDKKSKRLNGLKNSIILSTNLQEKKWPKLSKLIGWNCIQRRNFAILEAIERGATQIALIDDDNIPLSNWFKINFLNQSSVVDKYSLNKKIFDPIGLTNYSQLWHRGFPIDYVNNRNYKKIKNKKKNKFDPKKKIKKLMRCLNKKTSSISLIFAKSSIKANGKLNKTPYSLYI